MIELNIFLLDDDIYFSALFIQQLSILGYEKVEAFENSADCFKKLSEKPDIIFLDYNLGDEKGIDIMNRIKSYDNTIKIVIISSQQDLETALEAIKNGAYDYIEKGDEEESKVQVILQEILAEKKIRIKDLLGKNANN